MSAVCSIVGCHGRHKGRGLCGKHYKRWWVENGAVGALRVSPTTPPDFRIALSTQIVESGCWEWTRGLSSGGYGTVRLGDSILKAHRFSYEFYVGPIPDGLVLDHLCRNRRCVNPEHLEPVSLGENSLRGEAPTVVAYRENTCLRGHEWTPESTHTQPNGRRYCLTCRTGDRDRATSEAADHRGAVGVV